MRLSKRGEYGIRALLLMAELENGAQPLISLKTLAAKENIPPKFLEQIMTQLRNAGFLHSYKGPGGGYKLSRPADQITIGSIIRTLDGALAPVKCVSKTAYEPCDCPDEATCGLRMVMLDVRSAVTAILDTTTLAAIARRIDATLKMEAFHEKQTPAPATFDPSVIPD